MAASEAALELGSLCSVAAITDGPNGSYISALGRLQVNTAGVLLRVLTASALRHSPRLLTLQKIVLALWQPDPP